MKRILKALAITLAALVVLLAAGGAWYIHSKQPQRSGALTLTALTAPVTVRYDERGVPHIRAESEAEDCLTDTSIFEDGFGTAT